MQLIRSNQNPPPTLMIQTQHILLVIVEIGLCLGSFTQSSRGVDHRMLYGFMRTQCVNSGLKKDSGGKLKAENFIASPYSIVASPKSVPRVKVVGVQILLIAVT